MPLIDDLQTAVPLNLTGQIIDSIEAPVLSEPTRILRNVRAQKFRLEDGEELWVQVKHFPDWDSMQIGDTVTIDEVRYGWEGQ